MLTTDQINENRVKYMELLCKLNIDLSQFDRYLNSARADYFNKPYSTYSEGAYAGALCEHSLKLYDELTKLVAQYKADAYTEEDIIKVALFSELYKCELYEPYSKNQKNEATGQWETVKAYRNKEDRPTFGDIGLSSYMVAKHFFDLTDEQAMAIIYATNETPMDSYLIKKDFPLVNLVQIAQKVINFLL